MTGPVDQSQTYRYRYTVSDSSGVAGDAGTVTVTVTLPDGSQANPAPTHPSLGVYDISYTTSQVGLHNLKVSATGGVLAAEVDVWEDSFVVEESKRVFISVDEASNHLNAAGVITTAEHREQLRWLCMVASSAVERDLRRVIARRTVTETYDGSSGAISLRSTPVISITSVVESGVTLTEGSDYLLNVSLGVLLRGTTTSSLSWIRGNQNVVVTYVAGYTNPPRVAREAAKILVQSMWQQSQQASHPLLDEASVEAFAVAGLPSLSQIPGYDSFRAPPRFSMSTVPEVLEAIAVLGEATLPDSQVVDGPSTSVSITGGRMLLIGDEDFEILREPDSLVGNTATEEYVVPCAVLIDVPGSDQSVADTQAWADYELMEAAIIANPHLGLSAGVSLQATIVATQNFRRLADQNGRHTLVRFGVHIFATSN